MSAARRTLRFESLAEATAEAERLLAGGYDRAGVWSLAQCCDHLSRWLAYPLDGYPTAPLLARPVLWVVSRTVGKRILERYRRHGLPAGTPTLRASVAAPGGDDGEAVGRYREAARRFEAHPGEYLPSPLFGRLDRAVSRRVQVGHAAHHFGFLVPR